MNQPCPANGPQYHLGAVSFLNSKPLIEGLAEHPRVRLTLDVPARLPALLEEGRVSAALVPVIDVVQPGRQWKIISDACIGCDGETLTVRVFSRVPPGDIRRLHVDGDSHTSVTLALVVWQEMFGRRLELRPYAAGPADADCEAVLLIGDKVVRHQLVDLDIQTDLGGAWKSLTGLPFVFAVWAARQSFPEGDLPALLSSARDTGLARAGELAAKYGPSLGWPVELARRYLTHRLRYHLTPRHRQGLHRFLELVRRWDLVPGMQELADS